ncbi:MAG: IS91 family transposase, partial [Gammaproteobacteria bacterium]|nr:IS91 family transposase [Gammaproteobacteria bacterium]
RYSHRIAISDQRIIGMEHNQIHFHYRDYRDNRTKTMQLDCEEFIRRFLMHVLPKGLMRIRHYGLLANRCRKRSLETIRKILAQPETVEAEQKVVDQPMMCTCPRCHKGHLIPTGILKPVWRPASLAPG